MNHPSRTFILLLSTFAVSACATRQEIPRFVGQRPPAPHIIGRIAMVNERSGFVLIDSGESPALGAPLASESQSGTETAVLKASAEKKPPFIIADIVKGTPLAGETVVLK